MGVWASWPKSCHICHLYPPPPPPSLVSPCVLSIIGGGGGGGGGERGQVVGNANSRDSPKIVSTVGLPFPPCHLFPLTSCHRCRWVAGADFWGPRKFWTFYM